MAPSKEVTEADSQLFRQSIGQVKLVGDGNRLPPQPPAVTKTKQRRQVGVSNSQWLDHLFSDELTHQELESPEQLAFCRNGIDQRLFQRLKRGQFALEARLDLHGCTVKESRQLLTTFIHSAQQRGMKVVLIIHGRGNRSQQQAPILKRKVNYWLQQSAEVLAFCSAQSLHGGLGATYLLLRRLR
ncbi:DNA mismatch repair protein MutS [Ectothiorhodospiraceae bacterium BW-2]|nr:DNA mismatch repair protein MutS [Ectothiorhodospiraceae bacterium BW-2]